MKDHVVGLAGVEAAFQHRFLQRGRGVLLPIGVHAVAAIPQKYVRGSAIADTKLIKNVNFGLIHDKDSLCIDSRWPLR